MNTTYFFKDRPIFGFEIVSGTLRVVQIELRNKLPTIIAMGKTDFDPAALVNGVIVDYDTVAKAANNLLNNSLHGTITTRRVAMAIPSSKTFSRTIKLPYLADNDLDNAVQLEAEQYIPIPIDQLYFDYSIISKTATEIELFAVATPKQVVDSYTNLARILDLEPVIIESSTEAITRLFTTTEDTALPSVLINFGGSAADITIVNKSTIATGTVSGGGDNFTANISSYLGVTQQEAHIIKTKYGLNYSKKQREINEALEPLLDQFFKEIRRMIRYYEERYGNKHRIAQIVLMGGINVPGLSDHMTDVLRLPVRSSDSWSKIRSAVPNPGLAELNSFLTTAGLALIKHEEIYSHD